MKIKLLLYLLFVSLVGYSQKLVEILPNKSVAKVVLSGKKDYNYYALSEKTGTMYTVTGPGKITLYIRVRIGNEQFKSEPFKLKYIRLQKEIKIIDIPELLSGKLALKNKSLVGVPTRMYKVEINVLPGKHIYKFYKYKTTQKTYLRAFYESYPKPVWVDVIPKSKLEEKNIRFIKKNTIKSYYEISKQKGFDFSIDDSSRLRVIVRPEFSYNMLEGTILKIKLQNISTGKSKIYKLTSNKSDKTEFVSEKEMTTGTSSIFYLILNKPLHTIDNYTIKILSGAKAAVIRISNDKSFLK